MGMTLSEKIISQHCGYDVKPGDLCLVDIDFIFAHDLSGPLTISQLKSLNMGKLKYPERVAFFLDHSSPSSTVAAASDHALIRKFCTENEIQLFDVGNGIAHQLIMEQIARPGQLIIGGDSHTCMGGVVGAFATGMGSTDVAIAMLLGRSWLKVPETLQFEIKGQLKPGVYVKDIMLYIIGLISVSGATYKSLEFVGETIEKMPLYERAVLPNMAIEAGAKAGLCPSDEITKNYLAEFGRPQDYKPLQPDQDANYKKKFTVDVTDLEPQIALPHSVDAVVPVGSDKCKNIPINQVYLGTCTNGRIEDFRVAAYILKSNRIKSGTRLVCTPASRDVYLKGLKEGLWEIFIEAGGLVNSPGCGACPGVHTGILGDGENCISTMNRNFRGRMGNPDAFIYLASPATCAASAIEGKIADPRRYLG